MFFKKVKQLSVTAFKYILNLMNEVTISSSSNDISYKYWDYGYVVGAEVEYRKQLLIDSNNSKKLRQIIEMLLPYSNQELNADKAQRNGTCK
jgi:ribosomal protein L13